MKSDSHILGYFGPANNNQTVTDLTYIDGTSASEAIKCTSYLENFTGIFGRVVGGYEDCADINNHSKNIHLKADLWVPTGKFGFTVKGESSGVTLEGPLKNHGTEVDVDFGNWSDQGNGYTFDNTLNLWMLDGSKVRVRCLAGYKPTIVPGSGPYEYIFPKPNTWYHNIAVWFFQVGFKIVKKFNQ